MAALFRGGNFRLHSGSQVGWLIDCNALTAEDWDTLAALMAARLPWFGTVEGVPRGGLAFAEALRPHARPGSGLLIADDVCTTGASLERQRNGRPALGVVLFARGSCPAWVIPVFRFWGA